MNGNCIEIIGLNYLNIFDNFSVAFENKSFITLTGPNNCGKTTLIRIIDNQIRINNTLLIYGKKQEDYKLTELSTIVKTVIPMEKMFIQATVEEELYYQLPKSQSKDEKQKQIKDMAKKFKLTKLLGTTINSLSVSEQLRLQIAVSIISQPKILLIDDVSMYFDKKEHLELVKTLKEINKEKSLTIIMVVNDLECALESNYIYVISESEVVIEGKPHEVLEKDNILNKAGLELPFMIDLSVKLRDYDLIKQIELDMDRMVDTLWN